MPALLSLMVPLPPLQVASTPLPPGVAFLPGAPYTEDNPLSIGDRVVFVDAADANKCGVPHHRPCTVRGVSHYSGSIALVGPDGKQLHAPQELQGCIQAHQLVVGKDAFWLPLHYAVALGFGKEMVAVLLEAHREVTSWQ